MQLARLVMALIPVTALIGCGGGLSDQDRALLNTTNQNAEAAKQQSAQALDAARAAQASANKAEADASAANEKADRMFQRSMHK